MPATLKDYPLYITDEPATYEDFSGGINTDPSNEHLADNELRDCLNMTYMSGALVKRKGAKLLCNISCEEELYNIQGVFLFTYRLTYLIVAADGKLYQGFFNENSTVKLSRLRIEYEIDESLLYYDPKNLFVGLEEYYTERTNVTHDGFLYTYTKDDKNNIVRYFYRGNYKDITDGGVYPGNVVSFNGVRYRCIKEFSKSTFEPTTSPEYWALITNTTNISNQRIRGEWKEKTIEWKDGDIVIVKIQEQGEEEPTLYYYKCKKTHYCYNVVPTDADFFEQITDYRELIFQNTRRVEAATYNNKLYIATGTRFIEVAVVSDKLVAQPVTPYICNNTEISKIGFNYMSPYPEYCRGTQYNTVTTSISNLLAVRNAYGHFTLTPQMNFQYGETESDYYYRWEKKINGIWYTIRFFKEQGSITSDDSTTDKRALFTLDVDDADRFIYRVTFAKNFETALSNSPAWDYTATYKVNDTVLVDGNKVYKCLKEHSPSDKNIPWDTHYTTFQASTPSFTKYIKDEDGNLTGETVNVEGKVYWELILEQELLNCYDPDKDAIYKDYDWAIDKIAGGYFGQATSTLWTDISINDTFKKIHTCTKLHIDGNKILLYDDAYNSGEWFKTIVNEPGYITDRGCLSFKTTKNEAIVKVVAFQGNIIVFANSEDVGGSIHMVSGNGDDYDANDGYYSPYRRFTKNSSISCDNPNTIQVCENLLLFKYFDTVYYISASDLSNEVFRVTSCNDRIKLESKEVKIPWDDNSCISEVTKDYYALIWKEKYILENGELIQERPAIRIKMYYKISHQIGERYYSPWLRDESDFLNVSFILYLKGEPIYLFNNAFLSYSKNVYTDLGTVYPCKVHFRAVDVGYPKMFKLLSSVLVYYHRNQFSSIDFSILSRNEAGHILLTSDTSLKSIQDLRVLRIGDIKDETRIRVDSTILDSKVFNTPYKFPFLLADTTITSENDKEFSISSITYNYTSTDIPDSNPYDLYTSIIRTKEV